jgi:hypothetical protein
LKIFKIVTRLELIFENSNSIGAPFENIENSFIKWT